MVVPVRTFICANCGKAFLSERSDDEALTEYQDNFGALNESEDEQAVVCDDCYEAMIEWKSPSEYVAEKLGERSTFRTEP